MTTSALIEISVLTNTANEFANLVTTQAKNINPMIAIKTNAVLRTEALLS